MSEVISRVQVWSVRLRWTHAIVAFSTLALLLTGWIASNDTVLSSAARDYHFLSAYAFTISLFYRFWLFVTGHGSERFDSLLVNKHWRKTLQQHIRFYLSLGKTELQGWFAHNPFWGPLYVLILGSGLVMVISGFAIGNVFITGISLTGIHAFCAGVMLVLIVAHILAVFLHDARIEATSVSAIISGNKYFQKSQPENTDPVEFNVDFPVKPSDHQNP